jgi:Ni2+-binding GTPase involved in maturation of urease and hydrogenase
MGGETYDIRLKSPFTSVISGPTGSGKTNLVNHLIENTASTHLNHHTKFCTVMGRGKRVLNA